MSASPPAVSAFAYDNWVAPEPSSPYSQGAIDRLLDRPASLFNRQLGWMWRRGFRFLYLLDSLVLFGLLCVINLTRFGSSWPTYGVGHYLTGFAIATTVSIAVNYFTGLYERDPSLGLRPWAPRVALAMGIATLIDGVFAVFFDRYLMPRLNLAALFLLGTLALTMTRVLSRRLATRRKGPSRVALVGDSSERDRARNTLASHISSARVVLECDSEFLDPLQVKEFEVTDVFFVDLSAFERNFPEPLTGLAQEGTTVIQRVSAAETLLGLKTVYQIGGIPFIRLNTQGLQPHQLRLKRIIDLSIILLTSPLWLALIAMTAAYSKAVSSAGVFYRQTRVGLNGRHFEIVKFRTMYPNAEFESGPRLSERNDARVEPKLQWIRSSRLDELPQLLNVVQGHMSLVGPRPERPEFTSKLESEIPGYQRRHSIAPGITGYAQAFGDYDTDAAHKLGYDLQYLVNWSVVLDAQLILRSVFRRQWRKS